MAHNSVARLEFYSNFPMETCNPEILMISNISPSDANMVGPVLFLKAPSVFNFMKPGLRCCQAPRQAGCRTVFRRPSQHGHLNYIWNLFLLSSFFRMMAEFAARHPLNWQGVLDNIRHSELRGCNFWVYELRVNTKERDSHSTELARITLATWTDYW